MARRLAACCLALILSGCAGVSSYEPYVTDVTDPAALARDKAACLAVAMAYRPGVDLQAIGSAGAESAMGNAAEALASPLAPIISGAGASGSETLNQLGLLSGNKIKVYLRCLNNRGLRSGSYSVVDPAL